MAGDKLSFSSFDFSNETEFENIILKNNVLKGYIVYNAKKSLNDFRNYNRYADLLLVSKEFKYWSIGEVEVSGHSFKRHIFPQLLEINSLMEKNLPLIRESFLQIEGLPNDKIIFDLIKFNKPYLTLIIDKIPTLYSNVLPLLNSFCNVITISRLRDQNENYAYYDQSFLMNEIVTKSTTVYIRDNFISIDKPNLLDLNTLNGFPLKYKDGTYNLTLQLPIKVENELILIWTIDNGNLRDGKYKLTKTKNEFFLTRE
jgi:hypothetical protein